MPAQSRFLYSGIRVRNLTRSLAFYRRLGFRVVAKGTMVHGGRWVHLRYLGSHHRLELNYYPPRTPYFRAWRPGSEFDHFGFYAPDLAGWEKTARSAGARKQLEFLEGKMRVVYFSDPDGVWLEAFGPARPRPRRRVRRSR